MNCVTLEEMLHIMPLARSRIVKFLTPLNVAMCEFEINTAKRQSAFIAQIAHESGQLLYVREIASGEAYEGRADLGNVEDGDGVRFKGRGLIQITGRTNYLRCSQALFNDARLLDFPELLEDPVHACRSAAWFWKAHGLNELADAGDFRRITKIINGGYTHFADRCAFYECAKEALA